MSLSDEYFRIVCDQLNEIKRTQKPVMEKAADLFAECLIHERWIYLFGTGHSHMLAEELFYRAGGLARVRPILRPELMLHVSASESTEAERDLEKVTGIMADYPMGQGDVLLIASNSGRNAVPVELAIRAKETGAKVIALVSRRHCEAFPSRHPSGQRLPDIAELTIDNCGVAGDACVPVAGLGMSIGASSSVTGTAILQMVVCDAVEKALNRGSEPLMFCSSNADREHDNHAILDGLKGIVKHI
jgi:uncharacterized phosphosugar-binding protein